MEWSKQQQAIFNWFEFPAPDRAKALTVRARAGTGKTTTILEGINHAPEQSILLAAFNKNIATEIQSRLKNPFAEAKTLHALGFSIIRRFWPRTNVDNYRTLNIAGRLAGYRAPDKIKQQIGKLATKGKEMAPLATVPEDLYELANEFDCVPDSDWEEDGWTLSRVADLALQVMKQSCAPDGTVDFADMLYLPIANKWVRGTYSLVVVDEAQDMNASQIILSRRSVTDGGRIAVVGDDRQAIYAFRGADSGVIDRLKSELQAEELGLTITYRCPKSIVATAARIVHDYTAADSAPEGTITTMKSAAVIEACEPGDFILSRKNAPLVGFCLKILRTNKKAHIQGRDIGAGLINLVNKWQVGSLPEFLKRLSGWESKEVARAEASNTKNKDARIDRIHDQADTLRALSEGLSGVPELRARITSLFTDDGTGSVMCSTIHKAKGLEANRVYILAETLMSRSDPPCVCHHWAHGDKPCAKCGCTDYRPDAGRQLEERNLEYVAVTRAKDQLVWVEGLFI